ncbi:MAG: putative manganese-dependent inorganic diphosphatase [Lawsonibacter sp.]|jgi:manganese-dependent inorganic pyrophosphatase|nr:putative manganese-dependent inorganic diphosphatase [Lawsonibacter sp.]
MSNQTVNRRAIKIIGHRNPDTDSICSAIAYSNLKNILDPTQPCKPCRAGLINRETEFVLDYFHVPLPQLYTDVSPHIRDVDIRLAEGVDGELSLRRAWMAMRDQELDTLCIVDGKQELQGVITVKDVATANMDGIDPNTLREARTSYQNILDILNGTVLVGDVTGKTVEGRVIIGAGSAEQIEKVTSPGDIAIVSNRSESQLAALEMDAGCIIVCNDGKVPRTICMLAEEKGCMVITTSMGTYAAGQIISQAVPIRYFMSTENLLTFTLHTPVESATKVMATVRFRYFPVLDEDGKYIGVVSRRNMLNLHKKQLILVDHNEKSQAVEGIDEAEILEIIDHHRIGTIETEGPVYFRNVPVGCTCTIVYQMYRENGVEVDATTAGLLLSAILSDTLMFRSPTCTPTDERAARELAQLAGVDLEEYADAMFGHGGDVSGKTAAEVFNGDYKIFTSGDVRFGVGQGIYMTEKNRRAAQALVGPYLPEALEKQRLDHIFYMFTDARNSNTELLTAGAGAEELVAKAFGARPEGGVITLLGVVSRKKQMIPRLISAIKSEQE